LPPDEQQISNHLSGLSSDSSIGPNPGAPVQNGKILDDLGLVMPVVHNNVPAILALGVAPPNGPQEVDGPLNQGDRQELEDILLPDAQPGEQMNNDFNNVEMNYLFTQDW
jgi:hypothetical protein